MECCNLHVMFRYSRQLISHKVFTKEREVRTTETCLTFTSEVPWNEAKA